ncbi:MAG: Spy/CpxP family protein refolding chaperone, partial [Planctomycetaceae bacterium]|nr:Spy/CpxP family protein refolding chaperone [Planctomycetaceae bacterium]
PMLAGLDLTEDQKAKVEALMADHRRKAEDLGAKARAGEMEPAAAREAMGRLRGELHEGILALLTPEQREKLPAPPPPTTPGPAEGGR